MRKSSEKKRTLLDITYKNIYKIKGEYSVVDIVCRFFSSYVCLAVVGARTGEVQRGIALRQRVQAREFEALGRHIERPIASARHNTQLSVSIMRQ